jgi:DNA integrity scanning protein DisA with diadenylate cyclase activity
MVILITLVTSLVNLPAFSWLVNTIAPAMIFVIPVIFAPEIRRALERVGRFSNMDFLTRRSTPQNARTHGEHPAGNHESGCAPFGTPPRRADCHPPQ